MAGDGETLFARFEALLALPPGERAAALEALDVEPDVRDELRALLDADARGDSRLDRAVEGGARRVSTLATGLRLGPWRVLREIGAGGMGTVFLGERADGAFAQQVAIKVLRGFPTEDGMRRLRQERRILADLDHPNIARLLDGGETPEGQPYLVMEYVEGRPLADWLANAPPAPVPRLALFDKLAAAVAHAHRRLVIHRDLKPGNVLVRGDGEPKLLDFGVARLAALESGDSSTRVASLGWASPEQAAGGAVTTASDVYSLGVVLRVLLGGRDDREPGVEVPLADAELRGVIAMATTPDPGRRYPTVDALRDDLAAWRERRPLRALPDTAVYRARKFVRRHRVGVALGVLVVAGVAAFVAGLDRALSQARAQREIATRVGDFMVDMFNQAPPSLTEGRELTAREVVAAASARLLDDAQLDVQVRARLLERVAMLNVNLRDLPAARRHIEAADAERARLPPAAGALIDYTFARILAREGDLEAAARRNAAALAVADHAEDDGLRAAVLQQAMWLANRRGDYPRTLELAPRALAAAARSPEAAKSRLTIVNSQAYAEGLLGRYDAELASLRFAEQLAGEAGGASTTARSIAALNLASGLRLRGRLDEAAQVLERLEAFGRTAFATDHGDELVRILAERARLAVQRGDAAMALRAIDEALELDEALPPAQRAGGLWVVRSEALRLAGRAAEALALIDSAVDDWPDARPGDDIGAALLRALRAGVHCALERGAEAADDAAAARLLMANSPPWLLERLAVERRIDALPAACRR